MVGLAQWCALQQDRGPQLSIARQTSGGIFRGLIVTVGVVAEEQPLRRS